ncbi:MAG: hypothetical protein ACYTEI_02795 [Planctomycetota bacterium]|jgi:hypothetical protein
MNPRLVELRRAGRGPGAVRRCLLALGLVTAPWLATDPVEANSLSSAVPPVLRHEELQQAAQRLRLNESQLIAIERLYNTYQTAFTTLRRDEIEPFLAQAASVEAEDGADRPNPEALARRAKRIHSRIAALDQRLFDTVDALLADEQRPALARVRWARERRRCRCGESMLGGDRVVDLSELYDRLVLSPQEQAAAEPVMESYEANLTRRMREIYDANVSGYVDLLQARRDTTDGASLVETADAIYVTIRPIVAEARTRSRRACHRVCRLLAASNARQLRTAYYSRAYPEIAHLSLAHGDEFDQVRRFQGVDPDLRQLIAETEAAYRARIDRLIGQIADVIDRFDAGHSLYKFDPAKWEEREARIVELQYKVSGAHQEAVARLSELLGPELAGRLERTRVVVGQDLWDAFDEEDWDASAEDDPDAQVDDFIPRPISEVDLAGYTQHLNLSSEQVAVLKTLHDAYRAQLVALHSELLDSIVRLEQRLWVFDDDEDFPPADEQSVKELYELRRAAMERMGALETEFFENLESVLEDGQIALLPAVQRSRARAAYARGPYPLYLATSINEVSVDFPGLLEERHISGSALEPLRAELEAIDAALTAAFRDEYDAAFELQRGLERWEVVRAAAAGPESLDDAVIRQHVQAIHGHYDKLKAIRETIRAMNEQMLDRVVEQLPEDEGRSLRDAYQRVAFQEVYDDPESAEIPLGQALALDDLALHQHMLLHEIAADFIGDYARLSQEMIDIVRVDPGFPIGNVPEVWERMEAHEEALETRWDERDALSRRTLWRLRSVLTEGQIARIPGLGPDDDAGQD